MLNWFKKLFNFQPSPSLEQVKDFPSIATVLEDDRREREITNLQTWVNQPIIIISNSDPFISVGFGKDITFITQANDPILVFDCYSDTPEKIVEKISLASIVMFYDELKLDALLKLAPWEIGHLFYGRYSYLTKLSQEADSNNRRLEQKIHVKKKENYLLWNGFDQAVEAHYNKW